MKNSLIMLVAMFGVQFAGGIPISTLQSSVDGNDVLEMIRSHNARLLIMDAIEEDTILNLLEDIQTSGDIVSQLDIIYNNMSSKLINYNVKEKTYHVVNLAITPEVRLPDIFPEDMAVYFNTSGSTGKPKIVGHSHFGLFNSTYQLNDCLEIENHFRYFCEKSFGWDTGSPNTFLASGATRVFVSIPINSIDFLSNIIYQERCTHVHLPNFHFLDLFKSRGHEPKFSTVKTIRCAGERISKRYTDMLMRFCERLVIYYGSSEAAEVSAFSSQSSAEYEDGNIGKPLPGVQMKLVDKHGNVVPKGKIGELYVRSVYRFIEYKSMREKFLDTIDKGNWIRTGDLAHTRAGGNFILHGRTSDLIFVRSMQVFPQEVETVLISCKEVDAVVVVPVPDERLHHAICACIVLSKTNASDVKDLHTHFAHLWSENALLKPKYYIPFEEFPITASGKVDRQKIAVIATSQLNLCGKFM